MNQIVITKNTSAPSALLYLFSFSFVYLHSEHNKTSWRNLNFNYFWIKYPKEFTSAVRNSLKCRNVFSKIYNLSLQVYFQ